MKRFEDQGWELSTAFSFLGFKPEDEEEGQRRPIHPYRVLPLRQNYHPCTGDSSQEEGIQKECVVIKSTTVVVDEGRRIKHYTSHHRILLVGEGEEEEEIQKERVVIKSTAVVDEGRWIKHYSSSHRILLVGEGDFSFSACLAVAFRSASNMIATSLDAKSFLKENYQNALSNIEKLRSKGCKVMHGIDATEMANHALLGNMKFDRIIFNFPFAGFFKHLSRESQLQRHRGLVSMFLKNAKEITSENGEIHISHKINEFHIEWKLESMASSHRLRLIESVTFNQSDYPGYNTKCGFGTDNNFNCNPSQTYKFGHKMVRM